MKLYYLGCVVISAFWHAYYNYLLKKNKGSTVFLLTMMTVAAGLSVLLMVFTGSYKNIPWQYLPHVYAASFFYVLYQVLTTKAYEQGNISALYPLTVLSPIFIPVWALLFLGETVSVTTGTGIVITVLGAVLVKLKSFSWGEIRKIFHFDTEYKGARFALAASFVYSFGAVFDKAKIAAFPVLGYLMILVFLMTLNLWIYMLIWGHGKKKKTNENGETVLKGYLKEWKGHWKSSLLCGVAVILSFLFFRIALQKVYVSLVVPVRQVSIIFALLLGIILLKERFETGKLIGALTIILGIVLVTVGI